MDLDFVPRLSFFFNVHNDFFEEVAKFRAARRIWAREMRERYGAVNPRSWWMRCHAQTAGASLTAEEPELNVARVAIQALAAVLGGTQSLHTNSMDEAWALPTERAALIALRTQQVIADETGVANTVDPLGGSWFVESLTNEMEERARGYFARIDEMGGVLAGIDNGFFVREIADSAYSYQRNAEMRARAGTGEEAIPVLRVDRKGEQRQVERLNEVRRARDGHSVQRALHDLRAAAGRDDNLMPFILDAVRAYATLGETMDALRDVFGEHQVVSAV